MMEIKKGRGGQKGERRRRASARSDSHKRKRVE